MTEFLFSKALDVQKTWNEGQDVYIEGWLAKATKDRERDIIEPEAFAPVMDDYFRLNAPVSYRHNTTVLPAGHLQKATIYRDGREVQTADHPTDHSPFSNPPTTGSGVFVRAVINAAEPAEAIRKGNVAGFSFIGHGKGEKLPDGGRHIKALSTWIESTVSPYPVNQQAVFSICKAHGIDLPQETPQEKETPTVENIQELIAAALASAKEEEVKKAAVAEAARLDAENRVTKSDLAELVASLQTTFLAAVDEKLQKAQDLNRGDSAGRKGSATQEDKSLLDMLVQKSEDGADLTRDEDMTRNALLWHQIVDGMKYYSGE